MDVEAELAGSIALPRRRLLLLPLPARVENGRRLLAPHHHDTVVVADDDGVVVVARDNAHDVLDAARARVQKEEASRARYAAGELSLDVQEMREELARKGLRYVD